MESKPKLSNFPFADKATLFSDDIAQSLTAKIKRKGKHINTLTQSIDFFFNISNKNVKDGMFVKGKVLGKEPNIVFKPQEGGERKAFKASMQRFDNIFGYVPSTSLDSGLSKTADWVKSIL